jgi:hypothetical protein
MHTRLETFSTALRRQSSKPDPFGSPVNRGDRMAGDLRAGGF